MAYSEQNQTNSEIQSIVMKECFSKNQANCLEKIQMNEKKADFGSLQRFCLTLVLSCHRVCQKVGRKIQIIDQVGSVPITS